MGGGGRCLAVCSAFGNLWYIASLLRIHCQTACDCVATTRRLKTIACLNLSVRYYLSHFPVTMKKIRRKKPDRSDGRKIMYQNASTKGHNYSIEN
jgi:hypothetical protein